MWLFLNDAFLSVVAHNTRPDHLLVRSRFADDITTVFPDAEVTHEPMFDYPYRAVLSREDVATAVADELMTLRYPNFKNSVRDRKRHDTYFSVWSTMRRAQREAEEDTARPAWTRWGTSRLSLDLDDVDAFSPWTQKPEDQDDDLDDEDDFNLPPQRIHSVPISQDELPF